MFSREGGWESEVVEVEVGAAEVGGRGEDRVEKNESWGGGEKSGH